MALKSYVQIVCPIKKCGNVLKEMEINEYTMQNDYIEFKKCDCWTADMFETALVFFLIPCDLCKSTHVRKQITVNHINEKKAPNFFCDRCKDVINPQEGSKSN